MARKSRDGDTNVPVPPAGDVLEETLAVVAEQTGYPTDPLDPDLDLEADLGIDTGRRFVGDRLSTLAPEPPQAMANSGGPDATNP